MPEEKFKSKGTITFFINDEGDISFMQTTVAQLAKEICNSPVKEDYINFLQDSMFSHTKYDIISIKDFIDCIECGGITNYDGEIANIFVDGYKSNLGLCMNGFIDGSFLVSKTIIKELASSHEIIVNWANK